MCDGTRSCGYGGSLMVAAIMDTVVCDGTRSCDKYLLWIRL